MKTHSTTHDQDNTCRAASTEQQVKTGSAPNRLVSPGQAAQCVKEDVINRSPYITAQRKQLENSFGTIQRQEENEDKVISGSFRGKISSADSEELIQQKAIQKKENKTGMPDEIKAKMENSFDTDFSDVKIHSNSSKAPEVGAVAYTQGSDVHFAPGQFSPNSSGGQSLLGHELTHVVQQREGRVQPTTEVAGMPVNDSPKLEDEADALGIKAGK